MFTTDPAGDYYEYATEPRTSIDDTHSVTAPSRAPLHYPANMGIEVRRSFSRIAPPAHSSVAPMHPKLMTQRRPSGAEMPRERTSLAAMSTNSDRYAAAAAPPPPSRSHNTGSIHVLACSPPTHEEGGGGWALTPSRQQQPTHRPSIAASTVEVEATETSIVQQLSTRLWAVSDLAGPRVDQSRRRSSYYPLDAPLMVEEEGRRASHSTQGEPLTAPPTQQHQQQQQQQTPPHHLMYDSSWQLSPLSSAQPTPLARGGTHRHRDGGGAMEESMDYHHINTAPYSAAIFSPVEGQHYRDDVDADGAGSEAQRQHVYGDPYAHVPSVVGQYRRNRITPLEARFGGATPRRGHATRLPRKANNTPRTTTRPPFEVGAARAAAVPPPPSNPPRKGMKHVPHATTAAAKPRSATAAAGNKPTTPRRGDDVRPQGRGSPNSARERSPAALNAAALREAAEMQRRDSAENTTEAEESYRDASPPKPTRQSTTAASAARRSAAQHTSAQPKATHASPASARAATSTATSSRTAPKASPAATRQPASSGTPRPTPAAATAPKAPPAARKATAKPAPAPAPAPAAAATPKTRSAAASSRANAAGRTFAPSSYRSKLLFDLSAPSVSFT